MVGLTRFALVTLSASFQLSGNPWSDFRGWLVTWWPRGQLGNSWDSGFRLVNYTSGRKSALLFGTLYPPECLLTSGSGWLKFWLCHN